MLPVPQHPRGYVCYRAPYPLPIEGSITDSAWDLAPWTDSFVDIEDKPELRPWFETRVKMLWDDEYFYIAAEMEEPHLWATLTEHDSVIFQDNDFEVFIDPDSDNCEYYEFEINALGTTWDLRLPKPYRAGGSAVNEWEIPGLKSAIKLKGTLNDPADLDSGWTVELAFPWTVLAEYANRPSPPHPGDQWRVNFSRVQWDLQVRDGKYEKWPSRAEHNWVWSPQHAIDMHRPWLWGYVQFSDQESEEQFVPDALHEVRMMLHAMYWAWQSAPGEYASWHEAADFGESDVTYSASLTRFSVTINLDDGRVVSIDQDSRVTVTSPETA